MAIDELQSAGDRELGAELAAEPEVRRVVERLEHKGRDLGARRHLLSRATRLSPGMAPALHAIVGDCRDRLDIRAPMELFVYPEASFNAAAVRPEQGRLFLMVSSSLLEGFSDPELKFVVGHELGHYRFEHHRIPVALLLSGQAEVEPALALKLFAWQRYAEISSDRAGFACAEGLEAAARALFKLASGLTSDRVQVDIAQFLAQVGDLKEEADRLAAADERPSSDWFSTHPFSPLRLKAIELYAGYRAGQAEVASLDRLEAEVGELMTLMEPSYLQDPSPTAEAMRRLLFAGGVAIAASSGAVDEPTIAALEKMLGPGSIPFRLKPEAIVADLPRRVADVRDQVPPLRRAQVLRDLCVLSRADGKVSDVELRFLHDLAESVGVDPSLISCTTRPARG